MQLGTQTASVINHLHSRGVIGQPTPVVGMGVTLLGWTDRNAGTIHQVFMVGKAQHIVVTEDIATLVSGSTMSESQGYEFTPRPDGYAKTFRIGRSGLWEEVRLNPDTRRYTKTGGCGLRIGERDTYRDPTF